MSEVRESVIKDAKMMMMSESLGHLKYPCIVGWKNHIMRTEDLGTLGWPEIHEMFILMENILSE